MKTYTLLIWESVPESMNLYLIPDEILDQDDQGLLESTNGHYLNSLDIPDNVRDAVDTLSDALSEKPEHLSAKNPPGSPWAQRFVSYQIEAGPVPIGTTLSKIIRTGYLM